MKGCRHNDHGKTQAAAGGDPGWYASIVPAETVAQTVGATCSKCGIHSTMLGSDGECLRCRLDRRKAAREQGSEPEA